MARTKKATTPEERERAKDKRIQSKFGITLADRNRRAEEQGHKCKICGGPLDAYGPPNIDHFHFYVKAARCPDGWEAQSFDERRQVVYSRRAKTKAAAIECVKRDTMPWSIRGLLCFKCNRGLGSIERFFDAARTPENLLSVIAYLRARLNVLDNYISTVVI